MKSPEQAPRRDPAPRAGRTLRMRDALAIWAFSWIFALFLSPPAFCAPVNHRETSVGVEGTFEQILNSADYTPLPVAENTPLILRVHSVRRNPEGKYNYTFAYIGLQSGVYNLADYLQNSEGKRVRDRLPAMSVTVQALLPDDATATLPVMPTAATPRRIPYRPAMFLLILAWIGCGAALFHRKSPKPTAPPPPPTPPKTLGEILQPLALKAARKTITTEEKMLLEQTIIRYWSERLDVLNLDAEQQRDAILEDPEGGLLLRSIERWLYQPSSLILSSEVTKVLAPYFAIQAPAPIASNEETDIDPAQTDENPDELDDANQPVAEDAKKQSAARLVRPHRTEPDSDADSDDAESNAQPQIATTRRQNKRRP